MCWCWCWWCADDVLAVILLLLTLSGPQYHFGDNWGQITWNLSGVSPKWDWSSKRVKRWCSRWWGQGCCFVVPSQHWLLFVFLVDVLVRVADRRGSRASWRRSRRRPQTCTVTRSRWPRRANTSSRPSAARRTGGWALTHSLTHALTHPLPHSLAHSLTNTDC